MSYRQQSVTLDLDTDVTHECSLHVTRDEHLIGIISFNKASYSLKWGDLEYFRRRTEEFSVMPFPDCINAMIIDIRNVNSFLDNEVLPKACYTIHNATNFQHSRNVTWQNYPIPYQ